MKKRKKLKEISAKAPKITKNSQNKRKTRTELSTLIKEIQSEKKAIFRGRITIKKIGENEN